MEKTKNVFSGMLFLVFGTKLLMFGGIYLWTRGIMLVRHGYHWLWGFEVGSRASRAPAFPIVLYFIVGIGLTIYTILAPYLFESDFEKITTKQKLVCFFLDLTLIVSGIIIIKVLDINALKLFWYTD